MEPSTRWETLAYWTGRALGLTVAVVISLVLFGLVLIGFESVARSIARRFEQ